MQIVGVLLAGGQSSRFGSPKAFAKMEGKYFYERAYEALASVSEHVVLVTRAELLPRFPKHLHVVTDVAQFQGDGPLAGIYTAMLEKQAHHYVVLPCDMPYIDSVVLNDVVTHASNADNVCVCAVRCAGELHPLVSYWSRVMLDPIQLALEQGQRSVMKLLRATDSVWLDGAKLVDRPQQIFSNVNWPTEL